MGKTAQKKLQEKKSADRVEDMMRKLVFFLIMIMMPLLCFDNASADTLPVGNWSLVYVDSEEVLGEDGAAENAFDGEVNTMWHTEWSEVAPGPPHDIQIDLGSIYNIDGFSYFPRQDGGTNGTIGQYEFYVSSSSVDWGQPVATGAFNNDVSEKKVFFAPKTGQFIRLRALTEINGNPWTSVAEIRASGISSAPNGTINFPSQDLVVSVGGWVNFSATGYDLDGDLPLLYLWQFGEGSGIPDSLLEVPGLVQFKNVGTFTVNFTVTDSSGLSDPTPATRIITVMSGSPPLLQDTWSLVHVDSEELLGEDGAAENAFDGDVNTIWHTEWSEVAPAPPHEIQIDLGSIYSIDSFSYLPRQDSGTNGTIGQYEFYVSSSSSDWGQPVATGTFSNDVSEKTVSFAPKSGQLLRLRALTEVNGKPWTSLAELNVFGLPLSINQAPNGVIDSPPEDLIIRVGDEVDFAGTGNDPDGNLPLTYLWQFGADSGLADTTVETPGPIQFNNIGTFTVTFTVTDGLGNVDSTPATRSITVLPINQAPNGVIDSPPEDLIIRVGDEVDFAGTGNDPDGNLPLTYLWQFGADSGLADTTVETPGPIQFNNIGTFTVTFTVTDGLGNVDSTPATRSITVLPINQAPNGVIDSPPEDLIIRVGDEVDFAGTGNDPDGNLPLTYLWQFGADSGLADTTVETPGPIQFNNIGTFTVTFTVTDGLGSVDPTPANRTINVQSISLDEVIPNWENLKYVPLHLVNSPLATNPVLNADVVTDVIASFVADPFIFLENGVWHMFFEVYNFEAQQGEVGHAVSYDGFQWTYDRIVLDESFHLSYPFVFKYGDQHYMIPETFEMNEVRLYEAANFPHGWHYVSTLFTGKDFVDPSIFRFNDMWWLFVSTVNENNCYLYYSDDLASGWIEHPMSPVVTGGNGRARPGGRTLVLADDRIVRFSQNGVHVRAFEVDVLTETQYAEHELLNSPILSQGSSSWNYSGMHHVDPWWAGDQWLCAVDGRHEDIWSIGIYTAPPKVPWRLVYVDSEELTGEDGAATNAFDGNVDTFWHTDWMLSNPPPPHEIQIDLGLLYDIYGFTYLPRQDGGENGMIGQYEFYVSETLSDWGAPVAMGSFNSDTAEKLVLFSSKKGRYVLLRALTEVNGNPWTTLAEIKVHGKIN